MQKHCTRGFSKDTVFFEFILKSSFHIVDRTKWYSGKRSCNVNPSTIRSSSACQLSKVKFTIGLCCHGDHPYIVFTNLENFTEVDRIRWTICVNHANRRRWILADTWSRLIWDLQGSQVSSYDFPTLCTSLPHDLIKAKVLPLVNWCL